MGKVKGISTFILNGQRVRLENCRLLLPLDSAGTVSYNNIKY